MMFRAVTAAVLLLAVPIFSQDCASCSVQIKIEGFSFAEKEGFEGPVKVGDCVCWTNLDSAGHSVYSGTPGSHDGAFSSGMSGGMGKDDTWLWSPTNDDVGEHSYYCRPHDSMTGKVIVEAAAAQGSTGPVEQPRMRRYCDDFDYAEEACNSQEQCEFNTDDQDCQVKTGFVKEISCNESWSGVYPATFTAKIDGPKHVTIDTCASPTNIDNRVMIGSVKHDDDGCDGTGEEAAAVELSPGEQFEITPYNRDDNGKPLKVTMKCGLCVEDGDWPATVSGAVAVLKMDCADGEGYKPRTCGDSGVWGEPGACGTEPKLECGESWTGIYPATFTANVNEMKTVAIHTCASTADVDNNVVVVKAGETWDAGAIEHDDDGCQGTGEEDAEVMLGPGDQFQVAPYSNNDNGKPLTVTLMCHTCPEDGDWPATPVGGVAVIKDSCSSGKKSRMCGDAGVWDDAGDCGTAPTLGCGESWAGVYPGYFTADIDEDLWVTIDTCASSTDVDNRVSAKSGTEVVDDDGCDDTGEEQARMELAKGDDFEILPYSDKDNGKELKVTMICHHTCSADGDWPETVRGAVAVETAGCGQGYRPRKCSDVGVWEDQGDCGSEPSLECGETWTGVYPATFTANLNEARTVKINTCGSSTDVDNRVVSGGTTHDNDRCKDTSEENAELQLTPGDRFDIAPYDSNDNGKELTVTLKCHLCPEDGVWPETAAGALALLADGCSSGKRPRACSADGSWEAAGECGTEPTLGCGESWTGVYPASFKVELDEAQTVMIDTCESSADVDNRVMSGGDTHDDDDCSGTAEENVSIELDNGDHFEVVPYKESDYGKPLKVSLMCMAKCSSVSGTTIPAWRFNNNKSDSYCSGVACDLDGKDRKTCFKEDLALSACLQKPNVSECSCKHDVRGPCSVSTCMKTDTFEVNKTKSGCEMRELAMEGCMQKMNVEECTCDDKVKGPCWVDSCVSDDWVVNASKMGCGERELAREECLQTTHVEACTCEDNVNGPCWVDDCGTGFVRNGTKDGCEEAEESEESESKESESESMEESFVDHFIPTVGTEAGCGASLYYNVLEPENPPTTNECAQMCWEDDDCVAFEYHKAGWKCYLSKRCTLKFILDELEKSAPEFGAGSLHKVQFSEASISSYAQYHKTENFPVAFYSKTQDCEDAFCGLAAGAVQTDGDSQYYELEVKSASLQWGFYASSDANEDIQVSFMPWERPEEFSVKSLTSLRRRRLLKLTHAFGVHTSTKMKGKFVQCRVKYEMYDYNMAKQVAEDLNTAFNGDWRDCKILRTVTKP